MGNLVEKTMGKENDYVILSCVRSNAENNIGDPEDLNRMNEALRRAKYGVIIVGNVATL